MVSPVPTCAHLPPAHLSCIDSLTQPHCRARWGCQLRQAPLRPLALPCLLGPSLHPPCREEQRRRKACVNIPFRCQGPSSPAIALGHRGEQFMSAADLPIPRCISLTLAALGPPRSATISRMLVKRFVGCPPNAPKTELYHVTFHLVLHPRLHLPTSTLTPPQTVSKKNAVHRVRPPGDLFLPSFSFFRFYLVYVVETVAYYR